MRLDPIEIQWLNQFLKHRIAKTPESSVRASRDTVILNPVPKEKVTEEWLRRLLQEMVAPSLILYMAQSPAGHLRGRQLSPCLYHLN